MTEQNVAPITDLEIANARHMLELLKSQAKSGRVEPRFLAKQVDKMEDLLQRISATTKRNGQSARYEALYEVSRALGTSLDMQTVLDQVMDSIIKLTKAERGFLMLRDDDGGITVKAARNFDQQTLSGGEVKFSRTVTNQVMDTGESILTTNASEDPRFSGQASIVSQALRSVMATPLRARGNVMGAVYVDSRAMAGLFNDDDLDALDAFSGQAAIALDNAILFSETDDALSKRLEELRQLRRIDLLLNETLDTNKAMAYTLEWGCRLASADRSYLILIDSDSELLTVQQYGLSEGQQPPADMNAAFPEIKSVIISEQTIIAPESASATMIVPVKREHHIMGVVVLQRDSKEPFTEEQQDVMERIVARAAITIENARLYEAVQAADRAKSEFVGIVAHDLKSPMTGIKGYSELMLAEDDVQDEYKDYLRRIRDSIDRMAMLVSDLADISRIESGHFYMDETRVTVDEVIQAIKDSTLPQFKERNHQFIEMIEDNLPPMYVDYYRVVQILTNLVSNAYKYTPEGGTITIKAARNRDRIEFMVSDTGIGMTEENLQKLGTKFWRADDNFTRSQPGTGLGFSITRALIEQMGSQIEITSEVGKGSSFQFAVQVAQGT